VSSLKTYVVTSTGGIILSFDPLITSEAIITTESEVLGFGDKKTIESIGDRLDAEYIHLDGVIMPGFIDPHLHIDSLGFELSTINLIDARDRVELLSRLKNAKPVIGEWIVAGRFDHLLFPDQKPPTRRDLDNVISEYPVLLTHRSGHFGVLNTRGLKLVEGIIQSGEVDVENGWVYESTLWRIRESIMNMLDDDSYFKLLLKAQDHLLKHGVTTVGVAGSDIKLLDKLLVMDESGYLKIRTYIYLYVNDLGELPFILSKLVETRRRRGRVIVNGVKILLDGALGPRSAYLSQPYSDKPDTNGLLLKSEEWLNEVVIQASKLGLQIAVHAIGDKALDIVLNAYSLAREYVKGLRHRIEHASLIRDDQVERIKELKPVICVQPHFIITDKWIIDRVGYERVKWVYRFKTLYKTTYTCFSTDAPVEPVNPWETIYAAITRGLNEGLKHGELTLDERMSIIEALNAYTKTAGYTLNDDKLGCLLPGCYPDMIVLDKNPLEITKPEELLNIKVKVLTLS